MLLTALLALILAFVVQLPNQARCRVQAARHAATARFLGEIQRELQSHAERGTLETHDFGFSRGDRDRFWVVELPGADPGSVATYQPNGPRFAADLARLRAYHLEQARRHELGSLVPFLGVPNDPHAPHIDGLSPKGAAG